MTLIAHLACPAVSSVKAGQGTYYWGPSNRIFCSFLYISSIFLGIRWQWEAGNQLVCNGWDTVGAGETGDLPLAGSLPPQLQEQVQSCYSLEQWKHKGSQRNGCHGRREGELFRNQVSTGLRIMLEVSAEIPISHKHSRTCCPEAVLWDFTF